jgi:murein DD-endopeptidase MepM/ murein hydrolase activator NlpD
MFPLKKRIITVTNSEKEFLKSYDNQTEIPLLPHPGAFGKIRKNHQHEGVDLYCNKGDKVFSIEDGEIINIQKFTGEHIGSNWWNNTWCILIEGKTGVFNYGELIPNENIRIGQKIKEGDVIGYIETVLKKDKGRPINMLHLELYEHGVKEAIKEWSLNSNKPSVLKDPTIKLLEICKII